ncbi:MAG: Ku protein [Phycisphaeraceae bacterium]
MPPRAIWRGHLRISLVTVPVRLHTATESSSDITLHRLHKDCGLRVRNQLKCPKHGELDRSDIVKGYEFEKDRYAIIEDEELDQIRTGTDKVIDVQQFVQADELDKRYYDRPYYLAPDGPVAEQTFRMMREAVKEAGVAAIGRVVISSRERVVAISPQDKGLLMMTLRLANEVRAIEPYYEDIDEQGDLDKQQQKLARQLIENMLAPLELEQYRDRYEEKLKELVTAKIEGKQIVVEEEAPVESVDIMEALRQSVEQASARKPAAGSVKTRRKTGRRRKGA